LKIGIVLGRYPVSSETFIDSFISHLSDHQVVLIANATRSARPAENVRIRPYLNRIPDYSLFLNWISSLLTIPFYTKRLIILYRKGVGVKQLLMDAPIWTIPRLDVLHFPFGNLAFGREHYAELLGAKMTISFRGSDINVYPVNHSRTYNSIWPFVHAVHCNSKELESKLKQHKLPSSVPVTIIPAALRAELSTIVARNVTVNSLGTVSNPLLIMTLGRLHWIKDYPLALRVMAKLKKSGVIFKYYILGDGPDREQLLFLRDEMGLENEVVLAGSVNSVDILQLFPRAHIYLQTSYAEGFSNACLEAQAFGLPCIVPAISGMDVCVEHQKTGLIISHRDENIFADAIKHIASNPEKFDKNYIAGRVRVEFSLEKQKRAWLSFFEQFLPSPA
jgi:colanic acid/amylovoran biosynthesis glycosyltransferase